jgi:hypothetical protein
MNDWHTDLENKVKELQLKKEDKDVYTGINSRIVDRSSIGRSRSLHLSERNKKINNVKEKGGSSMITVEGALKDLEVIEKEANDTGAKAVVKALKVVVKFLSTMRSNQLLTEEEKVNIRKAKEARVVKEQK